MRSCPVCGGAWLRDLVYQHRVTCRIYDADSATIYRDHEARAGIRLARDHEQELIHDQDYDHPGDGQHYGISYSHHGGLHQRAVVILDDHGRLLARLEQPNPDGPTAA